MIQHKILFRGSVFSFLIFSIVININLYAQAPGGISSDLELWLKVESIAQGDNTEVSIWTDNSPNGFNATNALLPGPLFQSEITDLINFHPSVEFDGLTTGLDLGSNYIYSSAPKTGFTMLAVVQPDESVNKTRAFITDIGVYKELGYGFGYSYENIFAYTPNKEGAVWPDNKGGSTFEEVHTFKDKPVIVASKLAFSNHHEIHIDGTIWYDDESSNIAQFTQYTPGPGTGEVYGVPTHLDNEGPFTIGRMSKNVGVDWNNGRGFDGKMCEIIVYSNEISNSDLQKINTYLGIKYGISLPKDYVNSASEVIWSTSANGGYNYDIAGIMRDDASALDQRQSKAVNSAEILSIGKGEITATNAANPNAFANNLDCLLWGSNGGATVGINTTEKPATIEARLGREWKVKEPKTNTGVLRIQFDLSENGTISDASHLRLLVDADGDFSDATIVPDAFSQTGNSYYIDFDLSDGQYFTLASTNSATSLVSYSYTEPGMGINTLNIDPSAEFHVAASSGLAGERFKGVLIPRMTDAQMKAIVSPPTGLLVYNTDHKRFLYNSGTPNITKWVFIGGILIQTIEQLNTMEGYYKGEMRYNSTTDTIWYWNGSVWVEIDNN